MKNKILTITSDIFANEWAESFCKAILGNIELEDGDIFRGFDSKSKSAAFIMENKCFLGWSDPITFNLDELKIDWACLYDLSENDFTLVVNYEFENFSYSTELNLDYLAKQKGIEIK